MTYESKEDKTSFIIQCNAYDFDTMQFDIVDYGDDDYGMCITILKSQFYALQRKSFWNKIKLCWDILTGKEYRLFDLFVRKQDLTKFKEFINNNIKN